MSRLGKWFAWLYARTLSLYPAAYRAEFSDEMEAVFRARLRAGDTRPVVLILRELRDLPVSLLVQYGSTFNEERTNMTTMNQEEKKDPGPGRWSEAILAALPHLAMGLLIGAGKLLRPEAARSMQAAAPWIGAGLLIVILGVMLAGRRAGWPLWSASWYLYAAWIVPAVASLVIQWLELEESWRFTNILYAGWILLFLLGYFKLLTRYRLHGLLTVAPVFPLLGLTFMEFIPDPIEGWTAIGIGALVAVACAAIVRAGHFRLGVGIVAGLLLISGTILSYISEYQADVPPEIGQHTPSFENFLLALTMYLVFPLVTFGFPILAGLLWRRDRDRPTLAS